MQKESECPQDQRFLFTDILLPQRTFDSWKETAFLYRERQLKRGISIDESLFDKYINWKLTENQFALFTMYSYADFTIPKKYSCVFDMRNPKDFEECDLSIKISVYEGIVCSVDVDHGHKHLQVFESFTHIPRLVSEMNPTIDSYKHDSHSLQIGICCIDDYKSIKKKLIKDMKNKA